MIWFLLWIIITIVAIVYGFINGWDIGEKIFLGITYGIIGSLFGLLIFYIGSVACFQPVEKAKLTDTKEIYALADNSYLSGHGGFIYVTVTEEDKYSYMIVNEDGSYSKESVESENVRIKEIDDETPVLQEYTYESKNKFWSAWTEEYYVFVVPKGTVTHEFNVDLE